MTSEQSEQPSVAARRQRALERLHALHERYLDLVWYARTPPPGDPFWDTVPARIRHGAMNSRAKVEEKFPDEIDQLRCPECGDYRHGFNSGMLAATRLLLAYLHPQDTAELLDEQIASAEEDFPELDT